MATNERRSFTGRKRTAGAWTDGHLEDCVMEAYRRGCRDTIVAIGQSLAELLASRPPEDLEKVLRDTHGMLAPGGDS